MGGDDCCPCSVIAGGKVSQFDPDSAGLSPAWRHAVVETVCGFSWEDGTPTMEIQTNISQLQGWIKATHDLTPNDGAYFNEVSFVRFKVVDINLARSVGVPLGDQLAGDLFRLTLFDSQSYQGPVRSSQALRRCRGRWIRGLEREFDMPVLKYTSLGCFHSFHYL